MDKGKESQPQGTQELTEFVQNLLQQMQARFQEMSDTIIGRSMLRPLVNLFMNLSSLYVL
jgi:heat shock factor-binding protein 1